MKSGKLFFVIRFSYFVHQYVCIKSQIFVKFISRIKRQLLSVMAISRRYIASGDNYLYKKTKSLKTRYISTKYSMKAIKRKIIPKMRLKFNIS